MPHAYDTGLPMAQRTILREAIARRLQPLLKSNGGYLAAVVELPKQARNVAPDSDDESMLFKFLGGRSPAVGIALGRRSSESSGSLATEMRSTIDVHVFIISQHSRDHVDGRLAADAVAIADVTKDPGIEIMLEHVEQLLQGHTPRDADGSEIATLGEMRATDEDELDTFADITVWEQRYEIAVERVIKPARAVTQLLLSIQGLHREDGTAALPTDAAPGITPITTLATLSPPEAS